MGRVFAFTDLHGNYNLWKQIQNFLKADDKAFFLGDAADRGEDGWKIIKEILEDERITYIYGNHEDLLFNRYKDNGLEVFTLTESAMLHQINGGDSTYMSLVKDDKDIIENTIEKIAKLPLVSNYINKNDIAITMTHSGSTNFQNINDLIWDRKHFKCKTEHFDNPSVIIHGHTPNEYIKDLLDFDGYNEEIYDKYGVSAYWYAENTKCCIDCCTIETNKIILLDLDTFEEIIFEDKKL